MATNVAQSNPFQQTHIALWGPTAAGKDWLFRSLVKELEYYNRYDHDFHYELDEIQPGNANPIPLSADPPLNIPGTTIFDDIHYVFRRMALRHDQAHNLSAHEHNIIIHNDKGENTVNSLDDPITFESTFQTLINAQHIFLVLGIPAEDAQYPVARPTAVAPASEPDDFAQQAENWNARQGGDTGNNYSGTPRTNWSRLDYQNFIRRFFAALDRVPGRNLAVCLTKSDQLNDRGEPWAILQRRYGSIMRREFEVRSQRHNIAVFVTSAAGFLKQDGKLMPNFQNGALRDPNRWNPVNAAAPFFWIFEQIERARLPKKPVFFGSDPRELYMPYPKPRDF